MNSRDTYPYYYSLSLIFPLIFFHASPLKYQSKSVSLFPNKAGFALGSIEGRYGVIVNNEGGGLGLCIYNRVAVHHVDDKDASANFIFKCHRVGSDIFSVNAISFHPYPIALSRLALLLTPYRFGTFATAGSDGTFNFWDKVIITSHTYYYVFTSSW